MKALLSTILKKHSSLLYILVGFSIFTPVVILVLFGAVFLYEKGFLLWYSFGLLILAIIATIARRLLTRLEKHPDEVSLEHLPPCEEWTQKDKRIWDLALSNIDEKGIVDLPWSNILEGVQEQISFVGIKYNPENHFARYAFSIPEALLAMEIWSRRFRQKLLTEIPVSQQIKLDALIDSTQKINRLNRLYRRFGPAFEVAKVFFSGGSSVICTFASNIFGAITRELGDRVERNAKQLMLEQVTQVAIDLYSGRLQISPDELRAWRKSQVQESPESYSPLVVILIGQVNSGKSSVINALMRASVAEVDTLPSTEGGKRYELYLTENLPIHLVDTEGLDGSSAVTQRVLSEANRADLIVMVSRANQPAKSYDRAFLTKFYNYFEANHKRKCPPAVLLTTHNDLLPPVGNWNPPYDLDDIENSKSRVMLEACNFTKDELGMPDGTPSLPVVALAGQEFNIDTLRETLFELSSQARSSQLNRERLQADTGFDIWRSLGQTAGVAKSAWRIVGR